MDQTSRILLIDDDEESRHDLETVLAFIGERTIPATSNYWQSPAMESVNKSSDIEVVIIGVCEQSDLTTLLSEIHEWESGAPFILIGSHDISSSLDSDLNAHITDRLDSELRHQQLLDALHKAKLLHEHFNRLRNFHGERNYNMFHSLVGESDAIQQVRQIMAQVAHTEVLSLIHI